MESMNARSRAGLRELLGWCGAMNWLYTMIYAYEIALFKVIRYFEGGWAQFFFMLLLALAIGGFSYRFGRDPNGVGKLAFFMTPAAILATATLGLLPLAWATAQYLLCAVLMAPAIVRSVYGVVSTARPGRMFSRYAAGFAFSFLMFGVWVALDLPQEISFLVPASLSVPAWLAARGSLSVPENLPETGAFKFARQHMLTLAVTAAVMLWIIIQGRMVLNNVFAGTGKEPDLVVDSLLTWVPTALFLLLFGYITDKGYERIGFICIIGLSLFGSLFALLPGIPPVAMTLLLIFSFVCGEIYMEYTAYAIPLYFLISAKRPVFAASLGCQFYLMVGAIEWKKDIRLPKVFMELGAQLLVSAAASVLVFILLVHFLFERYRETTLAAALYALTRGGRNGGGAETPAAARGWPGLTGAMDALLTPEEISVALLLIDGETQYGISRRLHRPSHDVRKQLDTIREKIIRKSDPNPGIAVVINEFKLTRRESDILRCLCRHMTNTEIAAELFLSDETVKTHVRNLMKKLPVENRQDVAALVKTLE